MSTSIVLRAGGFAARLAEETLNRLEADALVRLAADGQLTAYHHEQFWQCMGTLRDKRHLEGLWEQGDAPWKSWA